MIKSVNYLWHEIELFFIFRAEKNVWIHSSLKKTKSPKIVSSKNFKFGAKIFEFQFF